MPSKKCVLKKSQLAYGLMKLTNRLLFTALFAAILSTLAEANPACEPVPRDSVWLKKRENILAPVRIEPGTLVFIGDSITDFWRRDDKTKGGKAIWEKYYAPLHAVNLGLSGDRTQHVLWRLKNGDLTGLNPKLLVLLIGTNNTGLEPDRVTPRSSPAETIEGISAVVAMLKSKAPDAKILLLAIFPRGEASGSQRAQISEINSAIAKLHDGKTIYFEDHGKIFLRADDSIDPALMPDLLHPSEAGYQAWANTLNETLRKFGYTF
jgi:lysophospholipase L1-like esterase